MSKVRELQDLAFRHLKDYVDVCSIVKVYATADPDGFTVVIDSSADLQKVPPIIWRALKGYSVDVISARTGVKIPVNEKTFVCYQNERWVR